MADSWRFEYAAKQFSFLLSSPDGISFLIALRGLDGRQASSDTNRVEFVAEIIHHNESEDTVHGMCQVKAVLVSYGAPTDVMDRVCILLESMGESHR